MTPKQYWLIWTGLSVIWFIVARVWLIQPIVDALQK